jgi:hypothetical protein
VVGREHLAVVDAQEFVERRAAPRTGDVEDGRQRGHGHPQPGPTLFLPPTGFIHVGRLRAAILPQLFDDGGQGGGGLSLQGTHFAGRQGDAEQVVHQRLDLPLAESVSAGEQAGGRLQTRPAPAGGYALGRRGAGGDAAGGTGQAVESVFGDLRLGFGDLDDLMTQRLGVRPVQGVAAASALRRFERLTVIGGGNDAGVERMPGSAAAATPGRRLRRRPLDGARVARRRPRRVRRIPVEALFQLTDASFQLGDPSFVLLDDEKQRRLRGGRDLVPQHLRNRRLSTHAAGVEDEQLTGEIGL